MSKRLLNLALAACLTVTVLPACSSDEEKPKQQNNAARQTQKTETTVTTTQLVSEGLDLSRLPEMVKEAKDAQELEIYLNTSGVNNLDINQDGKVDYLNVEEFNENGQRGFLLYTYEDEQQTDIARISISQQSQTTDVVVEGNPQYYGDQARYQSSFPLGQVLLAAWLFNSMTRPMYSHSPYYAGRYPGYYRGTAPVSRSAYSSRLSSGLRAGNRTFSSSATRSGTSSFKTTNTTRSGAAKTSGNQRSLSNTQGQSFQNTTNKRPAGSASQNSGSGFGTSSNRSATSTTGSSTSSTRTAPTKTDTRPKGAATRSTTSRGSFGSSSNRSSTSSRSSSSGSSFGSSSRRSSSSSRSSGSRRRR